MVCLEGVEDKWGGVCHFAADYWVEECCTVEFVFGRVPAEVIFCAFLT